MKRALAAIALALATTGCMAVGMSADSQLKHCERVEVVAAPPESELRYTLLGHGCSLQPPESKSKNATLMLMQVGSFVLQLLMLL